MESTDTAKGEASRYTEAIGRRKTAAARVRLTPASRNTVTVNTKTLNSYFKTEALQKTVKDAFAISGTAERYSVSARVEGGGQHAQAEAVRHGISRALVAIDPELRKPLKKAGYLKRDPRSKERKKFGLRKARRAPQWSKR
jgi:small subunit ribosomal protein S9